MFVTKSSLPRPVVKWAGGKRQLIHVLMERRPETFADYFEPFFGGGALYLSLWRVGEVTGRVYLNDANVELINLYQMIRDKPQELSETVRESAFVNTREAYLACRDRFNEMRGTDACLERAALFLYLNHHGYNGLWRVNQKGEYNIPFGRYAKSPGFGGAEMLMALSDALAPATLTGGDFAGILPAVKHGDFVYLDPPYHPVSRTASFTSYTAGAFTFSEQERLCALFREADRRGAKVMLSNSVAPDILEMYAEFCVERVAVRRFINAKVAGRAGTEEIIVRNY